MKKRKKIATWLDAVQIRTHNRRITVQNIEEKGNRIGFERPTWKGETEEDLTAFSFIKGGKVRVTVLNITDEALENLRDAITVYLTEVLKK